MSTGAPALTAKAARGRSTSRVASWALVVLATLSATGAAVAFWASTLADAETFSQLATESLGQEEVSQLLAERLVDRFASDTVLGTSAKPVAVGLTRGLLTSDEFAGVFQASVRTAHEQLVSDRDDSVTVALAGAAPLLDPAVDPDDTSGDTGGSAVVTVVDDPTLVRVAHLLSVMDTVAWCCGAGWLLFSAAGLLIASDRRRMLRRLGSGLLVAGIGLVAVLVGVRAGIGHGEPADVHAAAAAMVTVFTRPLLRLAEILAVLGAVVAIVAVRTPPTARMLGTAAVGRARMVWQHPVVRGATPALALLGGLVLLFEPQATIVALTQGIGLALVVGGAVAMLGWLGRLLDRGRPTPEQAAAVRGLGPAVLATLVVVALTTAVAAGTVLALEDTTPLPAPDPDRAGCNGLVGLCDRRLDEVALAGTHNSMSSSAEPGWFLAEQRLPISGQLADGVRALMLDVYPGYVSEGRVRTDLRAPTTAAAAAADVTEEGLAALEHLGVTVGAIPPEGATISAYLCHAYCELGASDMVTKLRDIGDFLAYNPNEVLVIVLQDYLTGEQTQEVFEEAGLGERVWPLTAADPWPTLREMVLARRNIVVLSENHGGEVAWMPAAYDVMEETPYEFASPADFTCIPNRGGTGKPLFLVNHWIREEGHDPLADAELVNSSEALTARLAECERERGRQPGILAVDFVDVGDTEAVVGEINRTVATP